MTIKGKITRGKKWTELIRRYELQKDDKEIEWMKSQPTIVNDLKAYEENLVKLEAAEKAGFASVEEYEKDLEEKAKKKAEAEAKKAETKSNKTQ